MRYINQLLPSNFENFNCLDCWSFTRYLIPEKRELKEERQSCHSTTYNGSLLNTKFVFLLNQLPPWTRNPLDTSADEQSVYSTVWAIGLYRCHCFVLDFLSVLVLSFFSSSCLSLSQKMSRVLPDGYILFPQLVVDIWYAIKFFVILVWVFVYVCVCVCLCSWNALDFISHFFVKNGFEFN